MDDFEKICIVYKKMCDEDPKIKAYISPEVAPILLENQTMGMLEACEENELLESPKVGFREETDRFYL